jgi:hypothetical protein
VSITAVRESNPPVICYSPKGLFTEYEKLFSKNFPKNNKVSDNSKIHTITPDPLFKELQSQQVRFFNCYLITQWNANWIGHSLLRNCLLKHVTEGKREGKTVKKGKQGRRRKQRNFKEMKRH